MAHCELSTFFSSVWMSRSVNLVMSSKTNISRRISSTRSGSSWARFSSRLRSVARSMTLSISATLATPPAFSNCWLITLAMRCSRPFSTSWMISGLVWPMVAMRRMTDSWRSAGRPLMMSAAWDGGTCERIRAIVCGCSSMMNVSRFWLSTFCRKPNGRASIDWRTLSSVAAGPLAQGLLDQASGHVQPARAAGQGVGVGARRSPGWPAPARRR